jgi:uncharacterized membrane protein YdjX (TVP38/TMEM64 family)
MDKKDKLRKVLKVVQLAVIVVLVILLLPQLQIVAERMTAYVEELGAASLGLAFVAIIALHALKGCVMFIHILMLYAAAALLFTTPWAIAVTYIGLAVNFSVSYAIGRKLGYAKVEAILRKNKRVGDFVERKRQTANRSLSSLCFLMRLLPFPLEPVSMLFGSVRMPFRKYMLVSLASKSITMIPLVMAGGVVL